MNSTRLTSGFLAVQGKYTRQNEEPPKDTGEGGRERDSLTFSGTFLVNFHQKAARGPDPPRLLS